VWSEAGELNDARTDHTASLLPSGKVLVTAGFDFTRDMALNSAEIFDPATRRWTRTNNLREARRQHAATTLLDGKVVVMGGRTSRFPVATTEFYDEASGAWIIPGGFPFAARSGQSLLTLASGGLITMSGLDSSVAASAWGLPTTERWDNAGAGMGRVVSAASFREDGVARQSLATLFAGADFSEQTELELEDSSGRRFRIAGFGATRGQISFALPTEAVTGQMRLRTQGTNAIASVFRVVPAGPALFTRDGNGRGEAAALDAVTLRPGPFAARQADGSPNVVALYGTGLGAEELRVVASVDGREVVVQYAGKAPGSTSLDQINIVLPEGIAPGVHRVMLRYEALYANEVEITTR
jgi:uncharacterized protein (TIGR03437 family)